MYIATTNQCKLQQNIGGIGGKHEVWTFRQNRTYGVALLAIAHPFQHFSGLDAQKNGGRIIFF